MTTTNKRRVRGSVPKPTVEDRLLAGMEQLIEKGQSFGAVTVEELTHEAGIARATFYLHFADKGELVARLMGRLTQELVGSAGVWFQPDSHSSNPQELKRALTGIFTTFKKYHAIVAAIASTAPHDETVAKLHEQMMTQLCAQSRRAVDAVEGRAEVANVDSDMLADVLTWVIELYCARFISGYDGARFEALVDTFTHICSRAIFTGVKPLAPKPRAKSKLKAPR